jgi:hypothetical protein
MSKIGRNAPCPCGSGKKYKKCHGDPLRAPSRPSSQQIDVKRLLRHVEAQRIQAEQQQGLGRPIISCEFKGHRVVAVKNMIHHSPNWKTFHDFLFDYIKTTLGGEWGNAELAKPYEERHPILQWYHALCLVQQEAEFGDGKVRSAPITGAVAAYLGLAYNLYLLAHNAEAQARLIARLKNLRQFHGAYYETFVAAAFIKAGFTIELEDEEDGSTSHCEFTAIHPSGRRYSVEAKARHLGGVLGVPEGNGAAIDGKLKIGHQLYAALAKRANHTRVIFIDINVPDDVTGAEEVSWLTGALETIRSKEPTMTIEGEPAPAAYVFVTNLPYHHAPDSRDLRVAVLAEGFKLPDFKMGVQYASLREARATRDRHRDMFELAKTFHDQHVPSTFDGEIPEFAFGEIDIPRLILGNRYAVPDEAGVEVAGVLEDAIVMEQERKVWGVYALEDGRRVIATCPISEKELEAYRRHPNTFFGAAKPGKIEAKDALDLFDALFETYQHTEKAKLLEWLGQSVDTAPYAHLSQREIAEIYCEGIAASAFSQQPNTASQ